MANTRNIAEWQGKTLVDRDGDKIGKLQDVYVDVETDEPIFGTVTEGLFARHLTFLPLQGITIGPDDLQVTVSREQVKDAPNLEMPNEELSQADSQPCTTTISSTTSRLRRRVGAGSRAANTSRRQRRGMADARAGSAGLGLGGILVIAGIVIAISGASGWVSSSPLSDWLPSAVSEGQMVLSHERRNGIASGETEWQSGGPRAGRRR